jgi:hypothetical protein
MCGGDISDFPNYNKKPLAISTRAGRRITGHLPASVYLP